MPQEIHELLEHKVLNRAGVLYIHVHFRAIKVKVSTEHTNSKERSAKGTFTAHQCRICGVNFVLLVTIEQYICNTAVIILQGHITLHVIEFSL